MKNLFDIHTHTVASGHAYSTLRENIDEAIKKGLKVLGTSDHTEKMPGSCKNSYFMNYGVIKRYYDELIVIKGAEANIVEYNGSIDLNTEKYNSLEYVIASLHSPCISFGSIEQNTNALVKVMDIEKVKVIGHPDDSRYPIDYDKLTAAAISKKILIEINNSSLNPKGCRLGAEVNLTKMLEFGKKRGLHIILSSDAHICEDIGEIGLSQKLVEKLQYPKELILNYDKTPQRMFEFLNIKI